MSNSASKRIKGVSIEFVSNQTESDSGEREVKKNVMLTPLVRVLRSDPVLGRVRMKSGNFAGAQDILHWFAQSTWFNKSIDSDPQHQEAAPPRVLMVRSSSRYAAYVEVRS